jgi:hypothetical protein
MQGIATKILAYPAHSYVGMSSTATNVRALRLSVARRHQHWGVSCFSRPVTSTVLLLHTDNLRTDDRDTMGWQLLLQILLSMIIASREATAFNTFQCIVFNIAPMFFVDRSKVSRGTVARCVTFA